MDYIEYSIEKSYFNPVLTEVCLYLLYEYEKNPPKDYKCWRFMQTLFMLNKAIPKMELPYYWYKNGIVVDPETLEKMTGGIIRFEWVDDDCIGCQIEYECPCVGNPHHTQQKP